MCSAIVILKKKKEIKFLPTNTDLDVDFPIVYLIDIEHKWCKIYMAININFLNQPIYNRFFL